MKSLLTRISAIAVALTIAISANAAVKIASYRIDVFPNNLRADFHVYFYTTNWVGNESGRVTGEIILYRVGTSQRVGTTKFSSQVTARPFVTSSASFYNWIKAPKFGVYDIEVRGWAYTGSSNPIPYNQWFRRVEFYR